MKSYGHILERAADWGNLSDSFDYQLRGKRKKTPRGRWLLRHRDEVIKELQREILDGTFAPGRYIEKKIVERGKERIIQSIDLKKAIGIHAIMKVVEECINPSLIADSAASIKGRGGVYLLQRILHDLHRDHDGCHLVYKDDIVKFYHNISQDMVMDMVRKKFREKKLVAILERFVRMVEEGLSIGMRPSQGLANLYLSVWIDHVMKDKEAAKYYRHYCDDRMIQEGSAYELTRLIRIIQERTSAAKLEIKANAQVFDMDNRPVDFLGYVIHGDGKVEIRKHIKQRFARRWKRVRSNRRKKELIGSFYGIAKHAHARHLFRKLTGMTMTRFSECGFTYQSKDGKKDFPVPTVSLGELQNRVVTVEDFEVDMKTREGDGRYLVLFDCKEIGRGKFFTNNDKMKQALDYMKAHGNIPFESTIKRDGKYGYMFT